MRRSVAPGVDYKVYKNTMTSRACDEVGFTEMKDLLKGMTALAVCENDPVAPAKVAKKFADDIETFEIKGGFLDGKVISRDEVLNPCRHSFKGRSYCKTSRKYPFASLQLCICFAGCCGQGRRSSSRSGC